MAVGPRGVEAAGGIHGQARPHVAVILVWRALVDRDVAPRRPAVARGSHDDAVEPVDAGLTGSLDREGFVDGAVTPIHYQVAGPAMDRSRHGGRQAGDGVAHDVPATPTVVGPLHRHMAGEHVVAARDVR